MSRSFGNQPVITSESFPWKHEARIRTKLKC
jgi:hypothetical protein